MSNEKSLTKKDIIAMVAKNLDMTKKDSETVFNEIFEVIQDGVVKHGKVRITDVMTIEAKEMKARKGRNPKTQEEIDIAARTQLFAKFGTGFKNRVNK